MGAGYAGMQWRRDVEVAAKEAKAAVRFELERKKEAKAVEAQEEMLEDSTLVANQVETG